MSDPLPEILKRLVDTLPIAITVITALSTVLFALFSGVMRRIKLGNFEIEGGVDKSAIERIKAELQNQKGIEPIPFEIEQLANYYSLTLGQSRISFWFSLIFAAVGFLVIIGAAFLHKDGDLISSSIKITSGLIVDAVAALFFVQSKQAQESMATFFEKLRNDRQYAEARKICDEIENAEIKDKIKMILVLHYSGLNSLPLVDNLNSSASKAI